MNYSTTEVPEGNKIIMLDGKLNVPNNPVVPFVEGDGIGPDIWRAACQILDSAVSIAYGDQRKISWMEVFAGQKAFDSYGEWLPDDTVHAFREFLVGIKGPLTTPVGGGIRSLNVALRQQLILELHPAPCASGAGPSCVSHPWRQPSQCTHGRSGEPAPCKQSHLLH